MGHVITFAQQKGGSGKTTLLAHLAHAEALGGKSVGLIDLDPQGSLTRWAEMAGIEGCEMVETASYRVGSDMRAAAGRHDRVFVDCPGSAASILEAAIRESDLVLCPAQASAMDIWATEATLQMCVREKTEARVVLNRIPPRGLAAEEAAGALAAKGKVLKARLGNRIAFARGFAEGTTALGLAGQAPAKAEIAALQREVARILKAL